MSISTQIMLAVAAILFVLGTIGFLTRRSMILMILSAEVMAGSVLINLVAFSAYHHNFRGQVLAILVLAVAACDAAVSLALIVSLNRQRPSLDSRLWRSLGEVRAPDQVDSVKIEDIDEFPTLTPSGLDPLERPQPIKLTQFDISIHFRAAADHSAWPRGSMQHDEEPLHD